MMSDALKKQMIEAGCVTGDVVEELGTLPAIAGRIRALRTLKLHGYDCDLTRVELEALYEAEDNLFWD